MEVKIPLSLDEVWALIRLIPVGKINTVVVETDETLVGTPPGEWRLLDWGRGFTRRSIDWTEEMLHEAFRLGTMRLIKIITRRGVYMLDRVNRYIFINDTAPYITPQHLMEMGIVAGRYEWVF
jgi:hypothetical protein